MQKQLKKILISTTLIIFSLIFISWFFPFSFLNFNKSISYTPDPIFVKEYNEKLTSLKSKLQSDKEQNQIKDSVNHSIDLLSKDWLTSNRSHSLNYNDINVLLSDVNDIQHNFINLERSGKIKDKNTLDYLYVVIDNYEDIKEQLHAIKEQKHANRSSLKTLLGNLHMSFSSNESIIETFYDQYLQSE
ncbi:hypothetical protein [Bacillus gobiensis]|uniref:hypothetical protein n=1 Tax=Bacillus gobiensis TaxID=1441095 RepID=UPI003D1D2BEC